MALTVIVTGAEISHGNYTASFSITTDNYLGGTITTYVYNGTTGANIDAYQTGNYGYETRTYNVSGLQPGATYYFYGAAYGSSTGTLYATGGVNITTTPLPNPSWDSTGAFPAAKVGTSYYQTRGTSDATSLSGVSTTATSAGLTATASGTTLVLQGTPTSSGTFNVSATANGPSGTTAATLNTTVTINPLLPPVWSDQSVSTTFVVGTAYSDAVAASNSPTYSVTSGALPTGISLNTSTGAITGTPTTKQVFSFSLKAANTDGNVTTSTFSGTTSAPPVWIDQTLADIYQGRDYSDGVSATDPISSSPTQYTITAGTLPTGLALNANTGAVTGITYSSGTYSFSITATNADGNITKAFSGTIVLAPYWTDNLLSPFIKGVDYLNGVTAANSPTYSVSVGTLPAGITLNTGTGALTGIPTGIVGTAYSFTLTATNGLGSISQAFSGTIQPDLGGKFRVYSGSAWADGDVYVYDGATWVLGQAYVYDGTNWIKTLY